MYVHASQFLILANRKEKKLEIVLSPFDSHAFEYELNDSMRIEVIKSKWKYMGCLFFMQSDNLSCSSIVDINNWHSYRKIQMKKKERIIRFPYQTTKIKNTHTPSLCSPDISYVIICPAFFHNKYVLLI